MRHVSSSKRGQWGGDPAIDNEWVYVNEPNSAFGSPVAQERYIGVVPVSLSAALKVDQALDGNGNCTRGFVQYINSTKTLVILVSREGDLRP